MSNKIEGYWYSKNEPQYPMPVKDELTQDEAEKIYKLIKQRESVARVKYYKGWSTSRIDGSKLGSHEYDLKGWVWPGDFAEHYVLKYRVKPSLDFLKFIGYYK